MRRRAYGLGAALLAAHALALPALMAQTAPRALAIVPPAAGALPAAPSARAQLYVDGEPADAASLANLPPGLRHLEWAEVYQGGFTRSVGMTLLRGETHPVGEPVCGIDLYLSAELLGERDTGQSPAALIREQIASALQGFDRWPVGAFRSARVALSMATSDNLDAYLIRAKIARDHDGQARPYLRVDIEVELTRATVPVVIAVVPRIENGSIVGRAYVQARVEADGFLAQALIDVFDGSKTASSEVRDQLEDVLEQLAARPPTLRIGHTDIPVLMCPGADLSLVGSHLRIPLATAGPLSSDLIRFPTPTQPPAIAESDIALAVDLSAANALLHQLWRSKEVESTMAAELPNLAIADFLTLDVRIRGLPMPPTLEVDRGGLSVAAEVSITIVDQGEVSPAELFVRAHTRLSDGDKLGWTTELSYLDVSCRDGDKLMSCYDTIEDLAVELAPPVHVAVGDRIAQAIGAALEERPLVAGLHLRLQSLQSALQLEPKTGQIVLRGRFQLVE